MKTSLICLLLLAAVACAVRQPKENAAMGEKMMQEKMTEARIEKMAEEKREEIAAVAGLAESAEAGDETALEGDGGKREARFGYGYSPCYGSCGPYACWFDGCYTRYDLLYYSGYCACCRVRSVYQCY